jgi:uroporphyrinogen decarboxylase
MRQAGRYMPQYQALRKIHTLWELFHTPALAAQVTLLPLEVLGVDAAILFSDILILAETLGFTLSFPEGKGPTLAPPLRSLSQLCIRPVAESLHFVFETIAQVKRQTSLPLIGFCGGPFTLASYLIDSTSRDAFTHTKQWMAEDPKSFHLLLQALTEVSLEYLQQQIEAGVDAIQVFDSWANILNDEEFARFCLPYLKQFVDAFADIPLILFCRSSSLRHASLSALQPACISCDWHLSMPELRAKIPSHIAVQGNFDPTFLRQPTEEIARGVEEMLSALKGARGVVVNLGHGVLPDIPVEHVQAFVRAAT